MDFKIIVCISLAIMFVTSTICSTIKEILTFKKEIKETIYVPVAENKKRTHGTI